MSDTLTTEQMRQWLLRYADRIDERAVYLTELDAAIGDADHGANMVRGMSRVRTRLLEPDAATLDSATLLRTVAMTLISHVGGAAGPLYGSFFMRVSKQADAENINHESEAGTPVTLGVHELARMFKAGVEGLQQRGKAELGEKTMVDALQPAAMALTDAAQAGATLEAALGAANSAAEAGMKHTIGMEASKGRASYLGARSIGHQDPGATSVAYLVATLQEVVSGKKSSDQLSVASDRALQRD